MAAIENENLDPEVFENLAEGDFEEDSEFEYLLEEEDVEGFNKDRSRKVEIDEAEADIDAWIDTQANILQIKHNKGAERYHLSGIDNLENLVATHEKSGNNLIPNEKVWFASAQDLKRIAHRELGMGTPIIKRPEHHGFAFELPPYMEEISKEYSDEFRHLAQKGVDGFIGEKGTALTQVGDFGFQGELSSSSGSNTYQIEKTVELDYDIDIEMADRNLPLGNSGLDPEQKDRVFDAVTELASTANERENNYEDWEIGVYETEDKEALLYLEDHREEKLEVLGFDENSNEDPVYDLEIKDKGGSCSESARNFFSDNRGSGTKIDIAKPLLEAAVNPDSDRTNNGSRDLKGYKIEVYDLVDPGDSLEKSYSKGSEISTGSGKEARLGGRIV